jgi:hypothetical protein
MPEAGSDCRASEAAEVGALRHHRGRELGKIASLSACHHLAHGRVIEQDGSRAVVGDDSACSIERHASGNLPLQGRQASGRDRAGERHQEKAMREHFGHGVGAEMRCAVRLHSASNPPERLLISGFLPRVTGCKAHPVSDWAHALGVGFFSAADAPA